MGWKGVPVAEGELPASEVVEEMAATCAETKGARKRGKERKGRRRMVEGGDYCTRDNVQKGVEALLVNDVEGFTGGKTTEREGM